MARVAWRSAPKLALVAALVGCQTTFDLTGRVKDSQTSAPVRGAAVTVTWEAGDRSGSRAGEPHPFAAIETDEQGTFEVSLPSAESRAYVLEIQAAGYEDRRETLTLGGVSGSATQVYALDPKD